MNRRRGRERERERERGGGGEEAGGLGWEGADGQARQTEVRKG